MRGWGDERTGVGGGGEEERTLADPPKRTTRSSCPVLQTTAAWLDLGHGTSPATSAAEARRQGMEGGFVLRASQQGRAVGGPGTKGR